MIDYLSQTVGALQFKWYRTAQAYTLTICGWLAYPLDSNVFHGMSESEPAI